MNAAPEAGPARSAGIRAAEEADIDRLLSLRRAFFQTQVEAGLLDIPVDPAASLEKSTARMIGNRRQFCFVATRSGEVEGYLLAQLRIAPGMTRTSIGSIEEIYVSPALRGAGAAARLLESALGALNEAGAERLQARVLAENEAARAFWRKSGFLDNVVILERSDRE
ncbi:GNAT family N-acetyltransferase [Pikeienuella sp. HZG-20]|uniref:GNAT family N-acetyltransferase n=1 Tax=Paludibacillus litoralis TaxID=3133267 RepID=UPI0030EE65DB